MSDDVQSIADLVAELLAQGCHRDTVVKAVRVAELSLIDAATYGLQRRADDNRLRSEAAVRKRRSRSMSQAPKGGDIYSLLPLDSDSQGSKTVACSNADDWPEDFGDQFWTAYPAGRKYDQHKVVAKLAKYRADKVVTWAALWDGLQQLIASRPDQQFTPAPMVWLNQRRWGKGAVPMQRQRSLSFLEIAKGYASER